MIKEKRNGKKTVEAANFTHSKNWVLMRILRLVKSQKLPKTLHLGFRVSKTQRDREHVRTTKMNLRRKKRTLTVNQTLSRNFTSDELETALMSL
jgi:hypothetical protein